jgi:hypothetical protein
MTGKISRRWVHVFVILTSYFDESGTPRDAAATGPIYCRYRYQSKSRTRHHDAGDAVVRDPICETRRWRKADSNRRSPRERVGSLRAERRGVGPRYAPTKTDRPKRGRARLLPRRRRSMDKCAPGL